MNDDLSVKGVFHVLHIRKSEFIGRYRINNAPTTAGKNHLLDVVFGNSTPVTQIATWYIGLINNTPTPSLNIADTLASHTGWAEATNYSGNRPAWTDADAASGSKGTTSSSDFTINADATLYGLFICSAASGTSGTLWSTGAFATGTVSVANGDTLRVSYTLSL